MEEVPAESASSPVCVTRVPSGPESYIIQDYFSDKPPKHRDEDAPSTPDRASVTYVIASPHRTHSKSVSMLEDLVGRVPDLYTTDVGQFTPREIKKHPDRVLTMLSSFFAKKGEIREDEFIAAVMAEREDSKTLHWVCVCACVRTCVRV